jgi:hypothetical protein
VHEEDVKTCLMVLTPYVYFKNVYVLYLQVSGDVFMDDEIVLLHY